MTLTVGVTPHDTVRESRTGRPEIGMHERFLEALTPAIMGPRLGAALSGPSACHVVDAKYEPGIYARIVYEHGGRLVRGDLTDDGGDARQPGAGRPPLVPPGVRLWRFPDDPDLASLPAVLDAAALGSIVRREEGIGGNAGADRIALLRYRPGKRATILLTLVPGDRRYVAKAYHKPDKAASVAAEAAALGEVSSTTRELRLAPVVAHDPGLAVVVQRAVDGIPLEMLIAGRQQPTGRVEEAVLAAARALAEFHALPAMTERHRSTERELLRFGERADRIAAVSPVVGAAAASLARRLMQAHATLPVAPIGPVHGDAKPSAFLIGVDGGPAYLLDLDHHGLADRTGDVGTFLASLRQLSVRRRLTSRSLSWSTASPRLAARFLDGYLAATGRDDLVPRIRWQEAVALERKALRAFSRAPMSPLPLALLDEADRCLDQLWSGR